MNKELLDETKIHLQSSLEKAVSQLSLENEKEFKTLIDTSSRYLNLILSSRPLPEDIHQDILEVKKMMLNLIISLTRNVKLSLSKGDFKSHHMWSVAYEKLSLMIESLEKSCSSPQYKTQAPPDVGKHCFIRALNSDQGRANVTGVKILMVDFIKNNDSNYVTKISLVEENGVRNRPYTINGNFRSITLDIAEKILSYKPDRVIIDGVGIGKGLIDTFKDFQEKNLFTFEILDNGKVIYK
ncbi:hypothetical protein [Halalkalibacter oceani]|uniref:hypothetical protein n=1 Tax=Halalkalibacter oceani TaxID=1653776 RepID=UPI003396BBAD